MTSSDGAVAAEKLQSNTPQRIAGPKSENGNMRGRRRGLHDFCDLRLPLPPRAPEIRIEIALSETRERNVALRLKAAMGAISI